MRIIKPQLNRLGIEVHNSGAGGHVARYRTGVRSLLVSDIDVQSFPYSSFIAPCYLILNHSSLPLLPLPLDMDAVLYQGSQEDRAEIRKYEFGYVSRKNVKGHKMQVVITTPETCMVPDRKSVNGRGLCRALSAIQWDVIVIDEGEVQFAAYTIYPSSPSSSSSFFLTYPIGTHHTTLTTSRNLDSIPHRPDSSCTHNCLVFQHFNSHLSSVLNSRHPHLYSSATSPRICSP
jgi:hypothetical protein